MYIRGGQQKQKLDFELAPYLIPFSLLHWFQKHKDHLCSHLGSASPGTSFSSQIYKGISKFRKEKYIRVYFQFCYLKMIFKAKSASETASLRSRRFFK